MLETLKQEYLGMKFVVEFKKHMTTGILQGLTFDEKMNFVNWSDACDWASKVTASAKVPFTILEMHNPLTGEMETF